MTDPAVKRLANRKHDLTKRRNQLQRSLDKTRGAFKDVARKLELARASAKRKRELDRIVGFDHTPVFGMHRLMLQDCREHGWSGVLASGIRWDPPAHDFGKKSQAVLYACFQHCVASCDGDCLPANPPTQGTHLLLGDGTAYGKPPGVKLPKQDLGLDVSEWDELIRVAAKRGYKLVQPYSSGSEAHHVNYYGEDLVRDLERNRLV